jgi:hypothetical protein
MWNSRHVVAAQSSFASSAMSDGSLPVVRPCRGCSPAASCRSGSTSEGVASCRTSRADRGRTRPQDDAHRERRLLVMVARNDRAHAPARSPHTLRSSTRRAHGQRGTSCGSACRGRPASRPSSDRCVVGLEKIIAERQEDLAKRSTAAIARADPPRQRARPVPRSVSRSRAPTLCPTPIFRDADQRCLFRAQ